MIARISLTLGVDQFDSLDVTPVIVIFRAQFILPLLALGIGFLLYLSSAMTIGLIFLASVTPEVVSPVMTELTGYDRALSNLVLVISVFANIIIIALSLNLLIGTSLDLDLLSVIIDNIILVIIPMTTAIILRAWKPKSVGQYDEVYPIISALMFILIMVLVTGLNVDILLNDFNNIIIFL